MPNFIDAVGNALSTQALWAIVGLSLEVSLSAVLIGSLIALPLGAVIAVTRFPGRSAVVVMLNSLMGTPTVIIGVLVYLLLSRSGPLGQYGLLFTPKAMVIAQTILVVPIIAAWTRQTVEDALSIYRDLFFSLRISPLKQAALLLKDCQLSLFVVVLAACGRALSEVGAVMIVGGNIMNVTRVMTTAITLETSKGDLPLALGLGLILMVIIVSINLLASSLRWYMSKPGVGQFA